jgi:hypothetical protein
VIFGYVDMTVYFNGKKYQQLGFMHLKVDVIIFSKNESIFDFQGYGLQYTIGKINVDSILTKDI